MAEGGTSMLEAGQPELLPIVLACRRLVKISAIRTPDPNELNPGHTDVRVGVPYVLGSCRCESHECLEEARPMYRHVGIAIRYVIK